MKFVVRYMLVEGWEGVSGNSNVEESFGQRVGKYKRRFLQWFLGLFSFEWIEDFRKLQWGEFRDQQLEW